MSKYRNRLPQLGEKIFLTDSGFETSMIFHEGIELPLFASFDLMKTEDGRARTLAYYERHIGMAKQFGLGFVLETATWRASPDWGARLGYAINDLAEANRRCVALMAVLRAKHETAGMPMVISANIGPRGDGYKVGHAMSTGEATEYHSWQVNLFRDTEADMVSGFTMNYVEEAIGVVRAAKQADMPCVISFTVETDGNLPSGQTLKDAIAQTDRETANAPAYYMINCAHPTHFQDALAHGEEWIDRIRGLRANSSKRSHAELDEATELDSGNPHELGLEYRELRQRMKRLTVLGGCCGTDHRHIEQICLNCVAVPAAA